MIELVKTMFTDIIENEKYDEALIKKYFSKDYIQLVDDAQLDLSTFKKHVQVLKAKTLSQSIEVINIAENENSVFTKHFALSKLKNGDKLKHKVLAEFKIRNGKIISCDELTFLVGGDPSGKGLGSEV